ncbi:hypothetical protein POX_h09826 [Penicillium oxalicum]|uniref:Uncharacterized protein n=1 Tax=Penicillium oxalicum (strain 114-2 / CGMCC 5302) TaxID=933388 RepID=S8B9R9_PENO1|nr:hypothetical protein POX_h09826 [Penicillium oxalicum]EPS31547.1 hypothetical protein PDE_06502 [Penicillium oxalicum 114-2]KAI2786060.1 hypothetical protein POX_h09826 [Penicillium oxalicum]
MLYLKLSSVAVLCGLLSMAVAAPVETREAKPIVPGYLLVPVYDISVVLSWELKKFWKGTASIQ